MAGDRKLWKRAVGTSAILGMVVGGLATGTVAYADDVPVGNAQPSVSAVRVDEAGTETPAATIEPKPLGNKDFEVEVDVADGNSLEDVATVKVCLRINTTPNCNTPNAKTNTQTRL